MRRRCWSPRCDNRLTQVLHEAGYHVLGAAYTLQAAEVQATRRNSGNNGNERNGLYGMKRAVFGAVQNVLLCDSLDLRQLLSATHRGWGNPW